ncbi:MAG: septum formation inhibitor Maf [Legionellales bacterium]|nr:septum formation inhibitor Maf [Legionellales bacterium]|tara:strand:+ start:1398 stop:1994 length:597 start_codon:yes stop_codon:yes gene_type:complete
MNIILASSSPARKRLLTRLQLPFITISPDIDETAYKNEDATALVSRLAKQKAKKVAQTNPNSLIIASDQVAVIDGKITGKPLTHENAVKQLSAVNGKICHFINGLCLLNSKTGHLQLATVPFDVKFRSLSPALIEYYLKRDKPYQCAGSIKSEGLAIILFEALLGSDPSALEGLPLITLIQMLEKEDVFFQKPIPKLL